MERGYTAEVSAYPRHPYTKVLLSAIPIADFEAVRNRKRLRLIGEPPSHYDVPQGCIFYNRCPFAQHDCKA